MSSWKSLLPTSKQNFLQFHAHFVATGLSNHSIPLRHLLSSAALHGGPDYAITILAHFSHGPTTFLSNTIISIFASQNHPVCYSWYVYSSLLYRHCLLPNSYSYPSLLKSLSTSEDWNFHARCIHTHIVKFLGGTGDRFVGASLVSFYGRRGMIKACRYLFDEIPDPDLPTWNSLLAAYLRAGGGERDETFFFHYDDECRSNSLGLFRDMLLRGLAPDEMTFVAVLGVCSDVGALSQGMWAHGYILRHSNKVVLNQYVRSALIQMYGKSGRLDLAVEVFDEMKTRDTPCYNAMISCLAVHGNGHCAIGLYEIMKLNGTKVDESTMISVLSACSHAVLVEEGRRCFEEMTTILNIEPKIEHYCCLIDLLGRAGKVRDAIDIFRQVPMKPTAIMYRSLLSSCRIHGESELEMDGDVVKKLMELDPDHAGNYVMVSNMYANGEEWDSVKKIRTAMREMGVRKSPGISSIEIDGFVYEFSTAYAEPYVEEISRSLITR